MSMLNPRGQIGGPICRLGRGRKWIGLAGMAGLLACLGSARVAWPAEGEKKDEIPPPQQLVRQTADGVQLSLTYFPGLKGKESIPVVLLHMYKGDGTEFKTLAPYLQSQGYAVVVPDLRGHGSSTLWQVPGRTEAQTLEAERMSPQHFLLMAREDVRAIKDFLWERNNAGELNLEKLCLVGSEMGASVAAYWALYDVAGYEWNRLYYGPIKLGGFVKAMVLISPQLSCRGLRMNVPLADPVVRSRISVMVMLGKGDPAAMSDARRIVNLLRPYHPEAEREEERVAKRTLFPVSLDTSLQGSKLLDARGLQVPQYIVTFIQLRLVQSEESKAWAWSELKRPHQ